MPGKYLSYKEEIPAALAVKILTLGMYHHPKKIAARITLEDGWVIPPSRIKVFLSPSSLETISIEKTPDSSEGHLNHAVIENLVLQDQPELGITPLSLEKIKATILASKTKSKRLLPLENIPVDIQMKIFYMSCDRVSAKKISEMIRLDDGRIIPCNRIRDFLSAQMPQIRQRRRLFGRNKEMGFLLPHETIPEEIEQEILDFASQRLGVGLIYRRLSPLADGRKVPLNRVAIFLESKGFPATTDLMQTSPRGRNIPKVPQNLHQKIISFALDENLEPKEIIDRIECEENITLPLHQIEILARKKSKRKVNRNFNPFEKNKKKPQGRSLIPGDFLYLNEECTIHNEISTKINTLGKLVRAL